MLRLPDQSLSVGLADAVHDVEFAVDHVSVKFCPCATEFEDVVMLTFGVGTGGMLLPPPPQA